jgi:hypothetical protein
LLFSSEGYKNKEDLDAALVAYEQLITTLQKQLEPVSNPPPEPTC